MRPSNAMLTASTRLSPRSAEAGVRPPLEEPASEAPAVERSPWRRLAGSLFRMPTVVGSGLVLLFWIACAVLWPLIVPYNPTSPDYASAHLGPSLRHLSGTDIYGRDVFSRVLAGSREVLIMAPAATLIGLAGGIILGLLTAYYGGWLDEIVNRILEVVMTFPVIIVGLLVFSVFGPSSLNTVLLIGIVYIPIVSRVVRSSALSIRSLDYVAAARLRGASGPSIMLTEILPNISGPILVEATVRVGYAVFTTASLSFIGLGSGPDSTDWGTMIFAGKDYMAFYPWLILAPTVAIASLVVALNLLSDGLRRAVSL
jgi:peptide/nickel transport system permease protein